MGGRGSGRRRDPKKVRRAVELRAKGLSLVAIGARLGLSDEAVRQILLANGDYCGKPRRPRNQEN